MTIQLPPEYDLPDVDAMVDRIVATTPRRSGPNWTSLLLAGLVIAAVAIGWIVVTRQPDQVGIPLQNSPSLTATPAPQPSETTSTPVTTPTPSQSTTQPIATPTGLVRGVGAAGFVTPSGRIFCSMSAGGVRCELYRGTDQENLWDLPADRDGCMLGGYGSTLLLTQDEGARLGCTGDTTMNDAALVDNPNAEMTGWWDQARDPQVETVIGPAAGLGYGDALVAGVMECRSESVGVTCRDTSSGAGFFISRERYEIF